MYDDILKVFIIHPNFLLAVVFFLCVAAFLFHQSIVKEVMPLFEKATFYGIDLGKFNRNDDKEKEFRKKEFLR
jgi:hypothetical protein